MQIKLMPEDFRVSERSDLRPGSDGIYSLYRLEKKDIGTFEAIRAVADRWRIPPSKIGYGGLKDRHAITDQTISIPHGPQKDLQQTSINAVYLGRSRQAMAPKRIAANEFSVVLRRVDAPDRVVDTLRSLAEVGVPNYFGPQRFGSLGSTGEFIARPWTEGNFQRALWLAIADGSNRDRSRERQDKALLREHWGEWDKLGNRIKDPLKQAICGYLSRHPDRYRQAFVMIPQPLRSLYLSAFQGYLFNGLLCRYFRSVQADEQLCQGQIADQQLAFWRQIAGVRMTNLPLPLPSSRLSAEQSSVQKLLDEHLAELGLRQNRLRVKYPRDNFFAKGFRDAFFLVRDLETELEKDDLNSGFDKALLKFSLPRGCYATVLFQQCGLLSGERLAPSKNAKEAP